MAAILWTDVTSAWPEIAIATTAGKIPVGAQSVFLSLVNGSMLDVSNFDGEDGTQTRDARILLAAHLGKLSVIRGLGLLASQSEGGASQSYIYPWVSPRMLQLTNFGQMFAMMCMGTPARAGALV